MAKEKRVWRIQADIPLDEPDPLVTLFVGPVEEDEYAPGRQYVKQDTRHPVMVPLSEVSTFLKGNDHSEVVAKQQMDISAEKAKAEEAISTKAEKGRSVK